MLGTGPSLVTVAVAGDTHHMPLIQSIPEHPFEYTPTGDNFHQGSQPGIEEFPDVCISTANMGNQYRIAVFMKATMQFTDRMRRCFVVFLDFRNLPVAGTENRLIVFKIDDVVIAARCRIARPFVARKDHVTSGFMKAFDGVIRSLPVRVGNLKVVSLMADEIEARQVPSKCEILFFGPCSNRRFRLGMQVSPKTMIPRRIIRDVYRITLAGESS